MLSMRHLPNNGINKTVRYLFRSLKVKRPLRDLNILGMIPGEVMFIHFSRNPYHLKYLPIFNISQARSTSATIFTNILQCKLSCLISLIHTNFHHEFMCV